MKNDDCVRFLQSVCPRLHLRWPGFRKVRRQVCKRIDRRIRALALADPDAYFAYLDSHPEEWPILDSFCRISISRFYRDRAVFDRLRNDIVPELARRAGDRGDAVLGCWSAGCASGEEPYTLSILWRLAVAPRHPGMSLHVTATDADSGLLARAAKACYPPGCLRDLPGGWASEAFEGRGKESRLRNEFRDAVEFHRQDIRRCMPDGPFDLVLCRNLAFTYFDGGLQARIADDIARRMRPGGYLIVGAHDSLPSPARFFADAGPPHGIYRRTAPQPRERGRHDAIAIR